MRYSKDEMLKQAFDAANHILQHKCTLAEVRRNLLPKVSEFSISQRLEMIKDIDLALYEEVTKIRKEAAKLAKIEGGKKAQVTYQDHKAIDMDEVERIKKRRLEWFKRNLKKDDVIEYRKSYVSVTRLIVSSTYPNFFKAKDIKGIEGCYYYSLIAGLVK